MSPQTPCSRIHLLEPTHIPTKRPSHTYILYFITGNPGLIEYYRTFLTHLYGLLNESPPGSTNFHVYGRSLSGFDIPPESQASERDGDPQYGLQEQIVRSEQKLEDCVRAVRKYEKGSNVRVILIGHSVGAYISLEIIKRLREKATQEAKDAVRIVGGVCLFPTVVDIAKSPTGRNVSWLVGFPAFALIVSVFAKLLTFAMPTSLLSRLIQTVMYFPPDAAHITASFVKSPRGVRTALHMARDELADMKADTWDTDIWGSEEPSPHIHPRPTLRFLFGENDHWIADETRDELIEARGLLVGGTDEVEAWKPVMEIDREEGWPHGFCIRHSVPVAERVFEYVRDIVEKDARRS